jgi:hypothetical protein
LTCSAARPLDPAALATRLAGTRAQAALDSAGGHLALDCLTHGTLPPAKAGAAVDPRVTAALVAADAGESDAELARLLKPLKKDDLVAALHEASARVRASDATLKPVSAAIDAIEQELTRASAATAPASADPLARDFTFARLGCASPATTPSRAKTR